MKNALEGLWAKKWGQECWNVGLEFVAARSRIAEVAYLPVLQLPGVQLPVLQLLGVPSCFSRKSRRGEIERETRYDGVTV